MPNNDQVPSQQHQPTFQQRPIELGAAAAAHVNTSNVEIEIVECRHPHLMESFSYAALIHDKRTGSTATIDTAEPNAIQAALKRRGWTLTHILITHHHIDHTLGNVDLIKAYPNVKVYGSDREKELIPGITHALLQQTNQEEETLKVGALDCVAIDTAGHTVGHLAFYFPEMRAVFCGDALFTLGAGKMMEGNAQTNWETMKRFKSLPDNTVVYSAHEYAESNSAFVLSVDPKNETLRRVVTEVQRLRHNMESPAPTVPSLMWQEKLANPFLRANNKDLRESAGIPLDVSDAEAFGLLREAKNNFAPNNKKQVDEEEKKEEDQKAVCVETVGVRLGATATDINSSILEVVTVTTTNENMDDDGETSRNDSRSVYSFVVRDIATGRVGLIDPGSHQAMEGVRSAIEARNWESPSALFFTHPKPSSSLIHELRKVFPSILNYNVFNSIGSATALDVLSLSAAGNYYTFELGATVGLAIPINSTETSGSKRKRELQERHEQQHFAFHFPTANVAFVGNEFTLLGYREEGNNDEASKATTTTATNWSDLRNLRDAFPPSTIVYSTVESAGRDAQFAVWADGGNFDLQMKIIQVARNRAHRPRPLPTVPFKMSDARVANPFLRMDIPMQKEKKFRKGSSSSAIRAVAGIDMDVTNDEAFEELLKKREWFFATP